MEFKEIKSNKRKLESSQVQGGGKRAKSGPVAPKEPALVTPSLATPSCRKRKADEKESNLVKNVKLARTKPSRQCVLVDTNDVMDTLISVPHFAMDSKAITQKSGPALSQLCTLMLTLAANNKGELLNELISGISSLSTSFEKRLETTAPEVWGIETASIAHFAIGDIVSALESDRKARVVALSETMVTCVWLTGPLQDRGPISYPLKSFELHKREDACKSPSYVA